MIVQQITHYPPKADQPPAYKILEKLGESEPVRSLRRIGEIIDDR